MSRPDIHPHPTHSGGTEPPRGAPPPAVLPRVVEDPVHSAHINGLLEDGIQECITRVEKCERTHAHLLFTHRSLQCPLPRVVPQEGELWEESQESSDALREKRACNSQSRKMIKRQEAQNLHLCSSVVKMREQLCLRRREESQGRQSMMEMEVVTNVLESLRRRVDELQAETLRAEEEAASLQVPGVRSRWPDPLVTLTLRKLHSQNQNTEKRQNKRKRFYHLGFHAPLWPLVALLLLFLLSLVCFLSGTGSEIWRLGTLTLYTEGALPS
ncbi:uncharacterized protein LOC142470783 isoform X2 [Ascaphus truei]|uniref:uncharacterized protein LOC142470783 isoform X2 n=1 Tax=Ascaphus truei TaxID=8439 RepID=UPI003F5A662E